MAKKDRKRDFTRIRADSGQHRRVLAVMIIYTKQLIYGAMWAIILYFSFSSLKIISIIFLIFPLTPLKALAKTYVHNQIQKWIISDYGA